MLRYVIPRILEFFKMSRTLSILKSSALDVGNLSHSRGIETVAKHVGLFQNAVVEDATRSVQKVGSEAREVGFWPFRLYQA